MPSKKQTNEQEIILPNEQEVATPMEQMHEEVKRLVQDYADHDYIARQLKITEDELFEQFGDTIKDATSEKKIMLVKLLEAKSTGRKVFDPETGEELKIDARGLAWLLEKIGFNPVEIQVIGAKNQNRPLVLDGTETGIRPAVVSPALAAAIEAEQKASKPKPRRRKKA